MKKLLTAFALLGTLVTPAFAQSFCNCNGADSVVSFDGNPTLLQSHKIAGRQRGLDSFATVPRSGPAFNSEGPGATGGGSLGYNEMLRIY